MISLFFCLLTFINCNKYEFENSNQSSYSDSEYVYVKTNPDTIKNVISDSIIYFNIFNNTNDTLVTINEILLTGFTGNTVIYPSFSDYTPNILFFYSDCFSVLEGDGKYLINFYQFPEFIFLTPHDSIILKLNITDFREKLISKTWELEDIFTFSSYSKLQNLVSKNYPEKKFYLPLLSVDTTEIKLFDSKAIEIKEDNNYNVLQNAFDIISR